MSSNSGIQDFVYQLVAEVAQAFYPLLVAFQNEDTIDGFLGQFGWKLEAGANIQQLKDIIGTLPEVIGEIEQLITQLLAALKENSGQIPSQVDVLKVIELVKTIYNLVKNISSNSVLNLEPFNNVKFQQSFSEEVMEYLIFCYVEWRTPRFFGILYFLGVFHEPAPDASRPRPNYRPRRTNWEMLAVIVSSPQDIFKKVYDWGLPNFEKNQQRLMIALSRLLAGFQIPAGLLPPGSMDLDDYYNDIKTNQHREAVFKLNVPLIQRINIDEVTHSMELASLGLNVMPVPPIGKKDFAPAGLVVYPFVVGSFSSDIPFNDMLKILIKGGFESTGGIWLELYPNGASVGFRNPNITFDAEMRMLAERHTSNPWILVGRKESTRFTLNKAHFAIEAHGPPADIEVVIEAGVDKAAFVLDFSESDGFLKKIFGEKPQVIDLATLVRWSSHRGLTVGGQLGLEFNIPLHQSIGDVIRLESMLFRLRAGIQQGQKPQPIQMTFALSGGIKLGPIAGTVDRVGVNANISFPEGGGNLGQANLSIDFKAPDGLGMRIDASVVTGGGYLFCDSVSGQYAGILQLEVKKKLALKAIGLLTTRMPDGSKGFSLLVIITAEFPPIQLGYGFTLNGVGGLVGINRTMVLDVLRAGVKTGALRSVLFPEDPVANATKIISDLRSIFPPAEGRYVFGPMVELGWGAGVVTVSLGIVIELPSPVRLAIMGRISLLLPPGEKRGLVRLQLDILGAIDFDKSDASIDATLYDSKVAEFPITGDMALRLNWGASSNFAMAAGGFNARYTPPPGFPKLERLAITISKGDNPRLRLEAYQALTANTVQFGARLDAYLSAGPFCASGLLSFDALVNFSPFYFEVGMAGSVLIRWGDKTLFSVQLQLVLSGPTPWHAYGKVNFEILGCTKSLELDYTTGQQALPDPLPAGDPLADLTQALADAYSWNAQSPDGNTALVTLRQIDAKGSILMHPFGELTFRQRAVPLNKRINRYSGVSLGYKITFKVESIQLGNAVVADFDPVEDAFAPAQFQDMNDDQKLSAPAFQQFQAGCARIRPKGQVEDYFGAKDGEELVSAGSGYETVVIDHKEDGVSTKIDPYHLQKDILEAAAQFGAAGQSQMRRGGSDRFLNSTAPRPAAKVLIKTAEYAVVSQDDLSGAQDETGKKRVFSSHAAAADYRSDQPGPNTHWQVVGAYEVK